MLDKHFDTVNHTWKHSDKCSVLKVFRSQLLVINHLPSVCQVFVKRTVLGLMDASLEGPCHETLPENISSSRQVRCCGVCPCSSGIVDGDDFNAYDCDNKDIDYGL